MKAEILERRPSRRYLAVVIDDKDRDGLENQAWAFGAATMQARARGPVVVVESGVIRGPTADAGRWRVGVQLDKATWRRFDAGEIDLADVLRKVGIEVELERPDRNRKDTATMKQGKVMTKAAGAVGNMIKALQDGARRADALGNEGEARDFRRRSMALKMLVAENIRQTRPEHLLRAFRGQGVPLVTNKHALPDDRDLGGL